MSGFDSKLDQFGRVVLTPEDIDELERSIALHEQQVAGAGTNGTCSGYNSGCTNTVDCSRTSNGNGCSNQRVCVVSDGDGPIDP